MGRLAGKRSLITGAAGGIGGAAAALFAREGAAVALVDINVEGGRRNTDQIVTDGGRAVFIEADITQPEQADAAVAKTVAEFGGLDVVYNNAGGASGRDGAVTEIPLDEFWRTISVDLFATFLLCRFAIPRLLEAGGGSIINTTSIRALTGTTGADAYTAAKGGVLALTRALAKQYYARNIRVNAIAPGYVLTERTRDLGLVADAGPLDPERPIRTGVPMDIAPLALYLASDESLMINGAIMAADGGVSAY